MLFLLYQRNHLRSEYAIASMVIHTTLREERVRRIVILIIVFIIEYIILHLIMFKFLLVLCMINTVVDNIRFII